MTVEISELTHRIATRPDVDLQVHESGQGTPVMLAHGFPELAYSWRHQIPFLAERGCRVIAPDQRGYGRSSRPEAVEDYDILDLTDDLLAVLDHLGEERAVFVGHDWGAMVAWQMSLLHPDRVLGVCGMSVPFVPRPARPPIQIMREMFAGRFFYMVYFQEPGVADADLGADPATTVRRMLCGVRTDDRDDVDELVSADDGRGFVERLPEPERLPDWLSQEELDVYVAEFERTGFSGGINWYRNMDRNWELTQHLDGATVEVPSAFIGGSADPVLVMSPPRRMHDWVTDHRGTTLVDGAGHWVQQERPEEVNAALLDFIESIRGSTSA